MIPVATPDEMREADAAAEEPVEVLIGRAGAAVARRATRLLGGTYGRRVVVLAGKGNNGNDGREAADRLARAGVRVQVLDAGGRHATVPSCDLVIDAAYGTGFRGEWKPPDVGTTPVLAVDIPSGVDGLTGAVEGAALRAIHTVTFAALKPGLLFPPGRELAGEVELVDIGLGVTSFTRLVERKDASDWLPRRDERAHKWSAAVWVVAGSQGMLGAAHLSSRAAQRAGAGMVRLSSPGVDGDEAVPTEVVGRTLPADGWAPELMGELDRFDALVVGPGLGRSEAAVTGVRTLIARATVPTLVDGDGLFAFQGDLARFRRRPAPTVLTPHDGEYQLLTGTPPGPDRLEAARHLASKSEAVVLLKGPATVVADPDGRALISATGSVRLATAGTGDVLSGTIGALLAQGMPPFEAAALGAWLHGSAAELGPSVGLVAGDLLDLLPAVLSSL